MDQEIYGVLFLCSDNSTCSILAEVILNRTDRWLPTGSVLTSLSVGPTDPGILQGQLTQIGRTYFSNEPDKTRI
jgi:hypothetical protein